MAWTKLTSSDGGAPALTPANGKLNDVLRWALPILGWDIEFGPTGNSTVFRAATGNRNRLQVRHDSAVSGSTGLALVRGAETATSATSIGSPFPTVAQYANGSSVWQITQYETSVVDHDYVIYGNGTFFYLFIKEQDSLTWGLTFFGDVPTTFATGSYDTVIRVHGQGAGAHYQFFTEAHYPHLTNGDGKIFWCRGIDSTTKSTYGSKNSSGSQFSQTGGTPACRAGYLNRIVIEKIALNDTGNAAANSGNNFGMLKRAWLPNMWNPVHSGAGTLSDQDTFTDTTYNASATFRAYNYSASHVVIIEETDTWTLPSG